jgi:hemerythrin-like metal-binding protein
MDKDLYLEDDIIDKEHEEILNLSDRDLARMSHGELVEFVKILYEHSVFHFVHEESFMKQKKMPRDYIDFHENVHNTLRGEIKSIIKNNIESFTKSEIISYVEYYRNEFIKHIKDVDSRMKEFL